MNPNPAFPGWLDHLSTGALLLAAGCAALVSLDLVRRPQKMSVMNLVWPVTTLFGGPLLLAGYVLWGRERRESMPRKRSFAADVALATNHCGAGCALGDLLAEWGAFVAPPLAVATGWTWLFPQKTFAVWILDYVVAFALGVAIQYFTLKPASDRAVGTVLREAVAVDAASITAWQVGMYGAMAALQFGLFSRLFGGPAPVDSPEFWFAMQLAMLAGFCTSYPVNACLVLAGIKRPM